MSSVQIDVPNLWRRRQEFDPIATDHPGWRLNNLTLTQRAALTGSGAPKAGDLLWDTTKNCPQVYDGLAWVNVMTEQFIALTATYTLASQTTVQALFNTPANGTLTVPAAMSYFFECLVSLSSMSATSGNFKLDLLGAGTATLTSSAWIALGADAATPGTAGTFSGSFTTGTTASVSSGDIVTAATNTAAAVFAKGILRVNAAGTLIPSLLLTTGAAAVVGVNSYFRLTPIGTNTVTNTGNWS